MQYLKVGFGNSSNVSSIDKGSSNPSWLTGNTVKSDKSTWYNDDAYYFYNLIKNNDSNYILYFQYGVNDSGYATNRFGKQELEIVTQEILDDGTIKGKVIVKNMFYRTRKTDYSYGNVRVELNLYISGQSLYKFSGDTATEQNWTQEKPVEINFSIPPNTTSDITMVGMETWYPDGEFINTNVKFGITLSNPNPPTYIPYAIRKSNSWKSLNSIEGHIKIRKSNSWIDKSHENNSTSRKENQGHNRIRQNGKWLQAPKM